MSQGLDVTNYPLNSLTISERWGDNWWRRGGSMRSPHYGLGTTGISASRTYFVPENMYQNRNSSELSLSW